MPYTRYFYPGMETVANAEFVMVGDESETKTYDFAIPPKQKDRKLEGYVFWPEGRPAEKVSAPIQSRGKLSKSDNAGSKDQRPPRK